MPRIQEKSSENVRNMQVARMKIVHFPPREVAVLYVGFTLAVEQLVHHAIYFLIFMRTKGIE